MYYRLVMTYFDVKNTFLTKYSYTIEMSNLKVFNNI
jgi:hypothetical protein